MDKNNAPPEDLDRYFPNFKDVEGDRLSSNSKSRNSQKNKLTSKELKKIGDRFFLYIFSVSVVLGFLGTIIPKTTIEQTLDAGHGATGVCRCTRGVQRAHG